MDINATIIIQTMRRRSRSSERFPGLEKPGKRQPSSALSRLAAAGGGESGSLFISSHAEDKQRKYREQRRHKIAKLFLAVSIPLTVLVLLLFAPSGGGGNLSFLRQSSAGTATNNSAVDSTSKATSSAAAAAAAPPPPVPVPASSDKSTYSIILL